MAIGDLLFSLMGQDDPRDKIAAALAQAQHPNALNQAPVPNATGGAPGSLPTAAPIAGAPGQNPAPPAPPQPQAYTSPPDLVSLYSQLADRQRSDAGVDRGLGLLFGAFAHPANRDRMMQAMEGPQIDPAALIGNSVNLTNQQQGLADAATNRANLPAIAQQLGLTMEQAQAMGPQAISKLLEQANTPTGTMKEYADYRKETLATGDTPMSLADFMRQARMKARSYGLQPQWAPTGKTDENGTPTYQSIQLANDGSDPKIVNGPDGKPLVQKAMKVDTPTETIMMTPDGLQVLSRVPKDVRGAAEQTAQGKAAQSLPITDEMRQQGSQLIDDILKNGDLVGTSGIRSHIEPYVYASSGDTQSKLNQLRSLNFLQAYNLLKGGGSISDAEGSKAVAAFSRLEHPELLTADGMKQALTDAKEALTAAGQAAHKAAGDNSGGANSAPAGRSRVYVPGKGFQ